MACKKLFICFNLFSNEAGNNVSGMDINGAYSHDLLPVSWAQLSK